MSFLDRANTEGLGPPRDPGTWRAGSKRSTKYLSLPIVDLRRFITCVQEMTDLVLLDVDRFTDIFDLERAPDAFVDLILIDLGNPFRFELDGLGKRKLAASLIRMYRQKGTAVGIVNAIRFFLGLEVKVDAHNVTGVVLGDLDTGWTPGPSDRRALYTFDIEVTRVLSPEERHQVQRIACWMKPAHTHFGVLREPQPPAFNDHWQLGVSRLSETTILDKRESSS